MDDKSVGKLWRLAHTKNAVFAGWWRNHAVDLIRKLVEERAHQIRIDPYADEYMETESSLRAALRDFGIDPKKFTE